MMLHDFRFGLTAASEVALLLGLKEKTIWLWKKDFLVNRGSFSEYHRGCYARYTILMDEEYSDKAS